MANNIPYLLYDRLINYLTENGHDRNQILYGSIPEATLKRLAAILTGHGLQIGGFVGVSHCFLASMPQCFMYTIDPNLSHRGIEQPLCVAEQMISHFKLLDKSMLIYGYAKEQMLLFNKLNVKFDFIILDGNHDYESVLEEVKLADPILKSKGFLILDDIDHWDGPKNIYDNFPMAYTKIQLDSRAGFLQKS